GSGDTARGRARAASGGALYRPAERELPAQRAAADAAGVDTGYGLRTPGDAERKGLHDLEFVGDGDPLRCWWVEGQSRVRAWPFLGGVPADRREAARGGAAVA